MQRQELAAPLLADHKESEAGAIFTSTFIKSQQAYFRQVCENAGLEVMTQDLEKTYLIPIVSVMKKLQYSESKSVEEVNALIKQINETRTTFVKKYQSSLSKVSLSKMETAFCDLASRTKNYLNASYAGLAVKIQRPALDAEADIVEAKLKKARDFCCIIACVGWCPLENLLTLCNCCGAGPYGNQECCTRECGPTNLAYGHWSMWAPRASIRSLKQDIVKQNEIIEQKEPIAMTMI